jgi:uncharacterized protein
MATPTIEDIYYDESPEHAKSLLEPLASAGDTDAQFHMGHLCDEEGPSHRPEAREWYRKASAGGHLEATHWLASFMYHGFGDPPDVDAALSLFRQCAEAGLDGSQWKLGQHLASEPKTLEEGIAWLRMAAAQGNSAAVELLAELVQK